MLSWDITPQSANKNLDPDPFTYLAFQLPRKRSFLALDGGGLLLSRMDPPPSTTNDDYAESDRLDALFSRDSRTFGSTTGASTAADSSRVSVPGNAPKAPSAPSLLPSDPPCPGTSSSSAPSRVSSRRRRNRKAPIAEDELSAPFLPSGAINPRYGLTPSVFVEQSVGPPSNTGMNAPAPPYATRGRASRAREVHGASNSPLATETGPVASERPQRNSIPIREFESGISNFTTAPDGPSQARAQSSASAPIDRRSSQMVSPMDRPRRLTRLSSAAESSFAPGNEGMAWGDDAERQSVPKLTTPYPSLSAFGPPQASPSSSNLTPHTGLSSTSRTSSYQTTDTQPTGISQSPDNDPQGLADQPGSKRAHHLARNRLAASKCRQRKKDWVAKLEQQYRDLSQQKVALTETVMMLRAELLELKQQCLEHQDCECDEIRVYLKKVLDKQLVVAGLAPGKGEGGPSVASSLTDAHQLASTTVVDTGQRAAVESLAQSGVDVRERSGGLPLVDPSAIPLPGDELPPPLPPTVFDKAEAPGAPAQGDGMSFEEMESWLLTEMGR